MFRGDSPERETLDWRASGTFDRVDDRACRVILCNVPPRFVKLTLSDPDTVE